jgi:hypothetical protein
VIHPQASDPTFEIQREAAKSFGTLGKNLPLVTQSKLYPWVLEKLRVIGVCEYDSENERVGSGHAMSELLRQLPQMIPVFITRTIRPRVLGQELMFTLSFIKYLLINILA